MVSACSFNASLSSVFDKLLNVCLNRIFCAMHCFTCCFPLSEKHLKKEWKKQFKYICILQYCLTLFPQLELAQRSLFWTSCFSFMYFTIFHWPLHLGYVCIYLLENTRFRDTDPSFFLQGFPWRQFQFVTDAQVNSHRNKEWWGRVIGVAGVCRVAYLNAMWKLCETKPWTDLQNIQQISRCSCFLGK